MRPRTCEFCGGVIVHVVEAYSDEWDEVIDVDKNICVECGEDQDE